MNISNGVKILIYSRTLCKYLLVLRDDISGIQQPNTWGLIGGGIDDGEEEREALMREIKEETNIKILEIQFVCRKEHSREIDGVNRTTSGFYYVGETIADRSNTEIYEGQGFAYFSLEEIQSLPTLTKGLRMLLQEGYITN